jgi:HK97 family phage major capsid protein
MSKRLNELRQQYNSTVKIMRDLHEAAEKENRGFSADERSKFDAAKADLDSLKDRIQREEQVAAEELRTAKPIDHSVDGNRDDPDADRAARGAGGQGKDKYDLAFRQYLAGGVQSLSDEQRALLNQRRGSVEQRDLSLTGASGGFTVPQGFYNTLVETSRAYGAFLDPNFANIVDTDSGNPIPVPLEDDTANSAAIVAEGTSSTTSTDATFASVTLGAFMYRSLVRVSLELLQDSAFNLEQYIARKLGIRLARGFNAHATTGTNSGQPQGIANASVGASIGHTAATGNTLNFPYISLVALEHSLDPGYRQNAQWMFGDGVLQALKQQLDSQNRPLWSPGFAGYADASSPFTKFPDRILGYTYKINQDMPVMAANARSIAFGDWSYYMVRRVRSMMIMRASERFIDSGQIGFYLFARLDGKYANPTATAARSPIRLGQNSAT